MIDPRHITGLVLAGGQGMRMGGIDKGLQPLPGSGRPLALHALERLAPQVGEVMLSANRHLAEYRAWGAPVWPDVLAGRGPLGGLHAGLSRARTPWVAMVPCDAPRFPIDLVARLAAAASATGAPAAVACARGRMQPVFCLVSHALAPALATLLTAKPDPSARAGSADAGAGRHAPGTGAWLQSVGAVQVDFDRPGLDDDAFLNINTLEALQALVGGSGDDGALSVAPAHVATRRTPAA